MPAVPPEYIVATLTVPAMIISVEVPLTGATLPTQFVAIFKNPEVSPSHVKVAAVAWLLNSASAVSASWDLKNRGFTDFWRFLAVY